MKLFGDAFFAEQREARSFIHASRLDLPGFQQQVFRFPTREGGTPGRMAGASLPASLGVRGGWMIEGLDAGDGIARTLNEMPKLIVGSDLAGADGAAPPWWDGAMEALLW